MLDINVQIGYSISNPKQYVTSQYHDSPVVFCTIKSIWSSAVPVKSVQLQYTRTFGFVVLLLI